MSRYMTCNYFLPFHRLSFHFVDCFLWCTEVFKFDVLPYVCFLFCCLGFWCHSQEIIFQCPQVFLPCLLLGVFGYGVWKRPKFILLHVEIYLFFQTPYVEETVLFPLCSFGTLVKNHLAIFFKDVFLDYLLCSTG